MIGVLYEQVVDAVIVGILRAGTLQAGVTNILNAFLCPQYLLI